MGIVFNPLSGKFDDNGIKVNLSGYVPYTGAIANLNIGNYLYLGSGVQSSSFSGLSLKNDTGQDIALFGADGGQSATFYDNVNLNSISQGSVLFAGLGGLVSQNNSNLYWDDTNNRLGIGTSTFSANTVVEIRKDQAGYSFLNIRNDNAAGFSGFILSNGSERARFQWNNTTPNLFITTTNVNPIYWGIANSVKLTLSTLGNLGINEVNPDAKLQANTSSAATKGIIVKGSASQTANLFEFQTSAGTIIDRIDQDGYIHRGDTIEWSETKALTAGAGGYIELGTMLGASISSSPVIEIWLQWYTGGNAQSRKYVVCNAYSTMPASWLRCEPIHEYNVYNNAVELDCINSGGNTKFRIIAPSTTNRPATVYVTYKLTNPYLRTTTTGRSTVWTASSTTGKDTSTLSPYPYTVVRQRQGELQIANKSTTAGYSMIVAKESQTTEVGTGTKGLRLYNTGRVTVDGSFGNTGGEFFGLKVNVPNSINDYCEFATISTSSFTAGVEIWTSVRQGGYSISKRYMVQMDYGATGGAWHKLTPIGSSGPYAGNDQDLEINIASGIATLRVRRVSGSTTSGIMYVGILIGAVDPYGSVTEINNTGSTTAPTVAFAPTAICQINGRVGIGGLSADNPTCVLDIDTNKIRVRTAKTPSSASDTGNQGDICWDSDYIYICTGVNTWKRTAIATW